MEHEPWRGNQRATMITGIHAVAHDGVSGFGQVNSDLVRSPRLERALDERRALEVFEDAHVRHRFSPELRVRRRAADPVAAVFDEARGDRARFHPTVRDRDVTAMDGMVAELAAERVARGDGAREDDEPGRFLVEPLNDAERSDVAA